MILTVFYHFLDPKLSLQRCLPKQIHGKGGRTLAEPSFAQSALQTMKSPENRSVITAVGLFAVRLISTLLVTQRKMLLIMIPPRLDKVL